MSGSCPCVQARDGIFVWAACIYAAVWSPVFLGSDFGVLLGDFIAAPLDPPLAFALWAAVAVAGGVLLVTGIRENLRDGHGAPVLSSLAVIFGCAVAMHHGWYLPDWGAVGMHISRGFYVAVIAASCANLCMAYAARARRLGRIAPVRPARRHDLTMYRRRIEALEAELAAARAAPDSRQIAAENAEMKAVLAFPGAREALLHALHSDHHRGSAPAELRARDETVAKLTTIYKRMAKLRAAGGPA